MNRTIYLVVLLSILSASSFAQRLTSQITTVLKDNKHIFTENDRIEGNLVPKKQTLYTENAKSYTAFYNNLTILYKKLDLLISKHNLIPSINSNTENGFCSNIKTEKATHKKSKKELANITKSRRDLITLIKSEIQALNHFIYAPKDIYHQKYDSDSEKHDNNAELLINYASLIEAETNSIEKKLINMARNIESLNDQNIKKISKHDVECMQYVINNATELLPGSNHYRLYENSDIYAMPPEHDRSLGKYLKNIEGEIATLPISLPTPRGI